MNKFTEEERVHFVKIYHECGSSVTAAMRKLRAMGAQHAVPSKSALERLVKKFHETGSVSDLPRPGPQYTTRNPENIQRVQESLNENPRTSVRRRSQELGLSRCTVHRILSTDIAAFPYKIQLTQKLKPTDHGKRLEFANWMLSKKDDDPDFFSKIFFSDEAHFHLNGKVNKQNCRIWALENPRLTVERAQYSQRVTVWCGLYSGGLIGPYFFENKEDEVALSVNGERYRAMLNDFLWPKLDLIDMPDMWFQQDGATCHTARATLDLIGSRFGERVISQFADNEWPPRSCDLTPLDFFLWGYLKSLVYANVPRTIQDLKANILAAVRTVSPDLCQKVVQNYGSRIVDCKKHQGAHLANIMYHQ